MGETIVSEKVAVAVCCGVPESFTVTTTLAFVIAAMGVPVIAPVDALIERVVGSPVADQVSAPVPPVAVTVKLYAVPIVPLGREVVVIVRVDEAMVSDKVAVAVCCGVPESFTVTTTLAFATAVVGVPVIVPFDALIESPAGNPVADQVYRTVPPVADTVALYAVPTVPLGRVVVVMVSGAGLMVSDRVAVAVWCVGEVESVTVIVTLTFVRLVTGVPVIAPVELFSVSGKGRPVADQVYGAFPPAATRVTL